MLVRCKYRRLFSSTPRPKKPGPTGPSTALIQAIVELKSHNARFGCIRIARIISHTFGVDIDKNVVDRVLAKHYRSAPGGTGPYWVLVVMDQFTRRLVGVGVHCGPVNGADLCRMFIAAIRGRGTPPSQHRS
jgi:putative transposase